LRRFCKTVFYDVTGIEEVLGTVEVEHHLEEMESEPPLPEFTGKHFYC
jgi:hypothetical protein